MEVPPAERRSDRHCENCEEELSQGEGSYKTGKLIRASLSIEAEADLNLHMDSDRFAVLWTV